MKTKLQLQLLEDRDVPALPPVILPPKPGAPYPLPSEAAAMDGVLAEMRESRNGHIRNVINANPTWTQAQKDAIIDAVLQLTHAADVLPPQGLWIGPFGSCNEWQAAFMETNMDTIVSLEQAGLVRVDTVAWDSTGTIGAFFGAAHVAIRITLPDGTVLYLDDGNWGNRDHTFMQGEVPTHFVPNAISTPPRTPWVPK